MSTTTREYRIRLSAQGKRELTQYLKSIGKDGEKELKRIDLASRGAGKGLQHINRSSRMAAGGLSVLFAQRPGIERIARTLGTTAIASGIVAIGTASIGAAKTFQASMNRVQGVMGATAAQMEQLEKKARLSGATTIFRASEAANAIEMLSKNGISYQQVMDGALDATLALAGGLGGELAPSADLITDLMLQFSMRASDLPRIVDLVTGAAINSKFGFDDLRLAIGQAGGVAGQFGIEVDEFLTALAATAAGFSSGQDAGTSFKTFLMRLTPQSKEAAGLIKDLGFEFFDTAGNIKSLTEIAGELQEGIKGLSEEARNDALRQIFGTDAIRTALLFANQGADGMRDLADAIGEVSAEDQAAVRLKGLEGALKELASAWEALQLTAADQGGLELAEDVVRRVTEAIRYLNENFEEVNEVIERVANALTVLLVARGMNFAIAKAAAMGAAYIDVATSLNTAGSAGATAATKITRVGVAARAISIALGGPLGLLTVAATLGALMIDLDSTEDHLEGAELAADKSADAFWRLHEATKNAADEQGRLGGNVSEATQKMLSQSRAELQTELSKFKDGRQKLIDDLMGNDGILGSKVGSSNELKKLYYEVTSAIRSDGTYSNRVLNDLEKAISASFNDSSKLSEIAPIVERLAGVGSEVSAVVHAFDSAGGDSSLSLPEAAENLINLAKAIGGFEEELGAIEGTEGFEFYRSVGKLRNALLEAYEASKELDTSQSSTAIKVATLTTAIGEHTLKIDALDDALKGVTDTYVDLYGEGDDVFDPVAESAKEAREEIERLGVSLEDQRKLYGQGMSFFDALVSKSHGGKFSGKDVSRAATKGLRELVRVVEGTNGDRGYNTTLDYGRWTNGPQNLTGKTLNEIIALQTQMLANPENRATHGDGLGSSALGAYQITRRTLRDLMKNSELGLTGEELFDEALQDRLFDELVRRRIERAGPGANVMQVVEELINEWEGLERVSKGTIAHAFQGTPIQSTDPEVKKANDEAREKRLKDQERERDLIDAIVSSGTERAAQLEFEATLIGKTSQEQTRLRFIYEKLLEAKRDGIDVDKQMEGSSETLRQAIERQAAAVAKLTHAEEERARKSNDYLSNMSEAKSEVESAFEKLRQSPRNIGEAFGDMADYISRKLWNLALDPVFDKIAAQIAGAFEVKGSGGGLGFVGSFFGSLFGKRDGGSLMDIPALAVGGMPDPTRADGRIGGYGSKTEDNILLWGSRDEFMMKAQAVDYYGLDFMDKLNSLSIPKRAEGGGFTSVPASSPAPSSGSAPFIGEMHLHATVAGDKEPEEQGERFAEGFVRRLPDMIDERIGIHIGSRGLIGKEFRKK